MLVSPINAHLNIASEDLEDGRVRLCLVAGPELKNEVGLVHGGVMSLLLDGAMGRAVARTLATGETCATVHLSVQFLSAAPAGPLCAESRIVKRGRRVAFVDAECMSDDGRVIARATGTWSIR
ncbi:MAG TPA: PaaI family thioesterase [Planctomycetota bacterium]|nr:PaaI family thioesterase [Planctomycetota bacterium]